MPWPNLSKLVVEHWFELIQETKCQCICRSFLQIPCWILKAVLFQGTSLTCSPVPDLDPFMGPISKQALGAFELWPASIPGPTCGFLHARFRLLDLAPLWLNVYEALKEGRSQSMVWRASLRLFIRGTWPTLSWPSPIARVMETSFPSSGWDWE